MSQRFDPLEFLTVAGALAAQSGEAEIRTAVGRVYYALFLLARERLGGAPSGSVHQQVIGSLRARSGYRIVADELDRLRRLRVVADYEMMPPRPADRNWRANWLSAQALAARILPRLQAL